MTRFPWETEQSDPFGAGLSNPFGRAAGGVPAAPAPMAAPAPASRSMGFPGAASSRDRGYNPMFDPGQKNAFGFLGRLMGMPSKEDFERGQYGNAQTATAQGIQARIDSGMSPQKAVLDFIQSPEGMQAFTSGMDLAQVANIAKLSAPDPEAAMRSQRQQILSKYSDADFLTKAEKLLELGDDEAAKIALDLAEEKRLMEGKDDKTGNITDYKFYVEDELKAGRRPVGFFDFVKDVKKAGTDSEDPDAHLRAETDKRTAELWFNWEEAGAKAAGIAGDMELLDALIPLAPQGPVVGSRLPIPILNKIPSLSEFTTAGQAFRSVVKRIAPQLRNPGSGATSDIEYQGFLDSLPALSNRPEANKIVLEVIREKALLDMERASIINQFHMREMTSVEARKALGELGRRSIITPEAKAILESLDPKELVSSKQEAAQWMKDAGVQVEEGAEPTMQEGHDIPKSFRPDDPDRDEMWKFMDPEARKLYD